MNLLICGEFVVLSRTKKQMVISEMWSVVLCPLVVYCAATIWSCPLVTVLKCCPMSTDVVFTLSFIGVIMTHCGVREASLILVHVAPCPGSLEIESRSPIRCAFRTAFADVRFFLCHLHVFLCSGQSWF
jgi:hypothetical protein